MKTLHRFLVVVLIFTIVFPPWRWAQAQSSPSNSPPRFAVIEIYDGKMKPQKVEQVASSLRDALQQLTSLKPLPIQDVREFIRSHPEVLQKKTDDPYYRYVREARDHFNNFEFDRAIALLEKTVASYRAGPTAQGRPFDLLNAYILLGYIYQSNNNQRMADQSYLEAIRLSPRTEASERLFPPTVTEPYRKLRKQSLGSRKGYAYDFQSNAPKTQIYLNGVAQGEAPLRVELPSGEHFLIAMAEGFQSKAQRLEVGKDKIEKVELKPAAKATVGEQGLNFTQFQDIASQAEVASNIGEAMNLDKIVLVQLGERGWNYKITALMVDPKYRAAYKQKSIEVVEVDEDTTAAMSVLAKDLEQMNQIDLAKNPERYAEGEVAVLGRKRKKSLVKNPWLWGAIGAVLVGGATAGILAGQRGDDNGFGVSGSTEGIGKANHR